MIYSKYGARKTVVNGIRFDSKAEALRYVELEAMEQAGEIKRLELQPVFELIPMFKKNGKTYRKTTYKADFSYFDMGLDKTVVEDVKSPYTAKNPVYRLKKKLFEYKYPELEIVEVLR